MAISTAIPVNSTYTTTQNSGFRVPNFLKSLSNTIERGIQRVRKSPHFQLFKDAVIYMTIFMAAYLVVLFVFMMVLGAIAAIL